MSDHSAEALRRYILGGSTEEESAAIEQEYFESADALNRVRAAEDDLIDEYVSGQLTPDERKEFERNYLTTPAHRRRVGVARALKTAASSRSTRVVTRWSWPAAAIAAALIIVALGVALVLRPRSVPGTAAVDSPPSATAPVPPPPSQAPAPVRPEAVVVVLSVSPILVRGSDQPASLTIEPGADVVRLYLQGQRTEPRFGRGRAIVRAVTGGPVWTGPADAAERTTPPALARVDIPAERLRPDDYIVELLEIDARGRDIERYRYFFRVRTP
jgi:hypothetical protein